jgi:hypothetical protein
MLTTLLFAVKADSFLKKYNPETAMNTKKPKINSAPKIIFFLCFCSFVKGQGLGFFFFSRAIPIGIPKTAPIAGPKAIFPIASPIGMPRGIPIAIPNPIKCPLGYFLSFLSIIIELFVCHDIQWWTLPDSNRPPPPCKSGALPDELRARSYANLALFLVRVNQYVTLAKTDPVN